MPGRFGRESRGLLVLPLVVFICVSAWAVSGCADDEPAPPPAAQVPPVPRPEPARGVVLLSVDTLRADHLGTYGYERDTSPNLDRLAARGVVFDLAFAHAPSTLISHMSLFTSLLPPEHGVKPPQWNVLSPDIPTLPEAFRDAGYRTAGFTEGGYMEGDHGFARGFDQWQDPAFDDSTNVERTLERGLDFLRSVKASETTAIGGEAGGAPFFLFLHTYSVHDPYEPPRAVRHRYWPETPPTEAPADASTLERVNAGRDELSGREVEYFSSRYDAGIRYFDGVLGRFLEAVRELGLEDQITFVLLSDHGEEFLDHGRMLHTQVYPELLRVPLMVVHPGLVHRHVERPVALVDLAPTLLDLAGLDAAAALPSARGRSLMPELTGEPSVGTSPGSAEPIYGEVEFVDSQRSLTVESDQGAWQLVERRPIRDPDGYWISRQVEFDVATRRVGLRLASFRQPRTLTVDWLGDRGVERLEERTLLPEWTEMEIRPPVEGGRGRLRLSVDGCLVPRELGLGDDPRCLGFMISEPEPLRVDLLQLLLDSGGRLQVSDGSLEGPGAEGMLHDLRRRLDGLRLERVADPSSQGVSDEERLALEALGYL